MRGAIAERFFAFVTVKPFLTIFVVLLPLLGLSLPALELKKDTRADAFLPPGHFAVEYRQTVKRIFGLEDPMLVAVINRGPDGVFNPQTLNLITRLSKQIANLPGIDPDRVMSLTSEKSLSASVDGLEIAPFLEGTIETAEEASNIRVSVMNMPFYVGTLVTEDGQGVVIAAEMENPDQAEEIYFQLKQLTERTPLGPTEQLLVAGEGALMGSLGAYIDRDAHRLTPFVAVLVVLLLYLSYRTALGVLLPALVAALTLGATLGALSIAGKPFYFITNGLPVILIAIAVADSIHILGQFYLQRAKDPGATRQATAVAAMAGIWRPIAITSLTTMAGFLSVYAASTSPPLKDFSLYAACGILVALAVSTTLVPALLVLIPASQPKALGNGDWRADPYSRAISRTGSHLLRHPGAVLTISALIGLAGVAGMMRLETNDSDIDNFRRQEPVRIAHEAINEQFDGAHTMDVVIETNHAEGLFAPERLRRIEALQLYLESLPHVTASRSIVDYIKQMNRALNDDRADAYALPDSEEAVAQYFLLYSMTGDSTDFEEEVDYDYRLANLRVTLDSGEFGHEQAVISAANSYLAHTFNSPDMKAKLSGRSTVHYYWMIEILESHALSVFLALATVGLMTVVSFRSFAAGVLALIPVALSVLLVYAIMGLSNIWLGIGTSMSAAIAIGVGVDFAIHVVDRIRVLATEEPGPLSASLHKIYASTGRALFFNFIIVFGGFGLLIVSEAPGLVRFGALVAVAVLASFAASLFLLPTLINLIRPRDFIFKRQATTGAALEPSGLTAP